jgi:hypothetical protein
MEASMDGKNWIVLGINDDHYFRGTDDINIECNDPGFYQFLGENFRFYFACVD